jgi:hypothetical protein
VITLNAERNCENIATAKAKFRNCSLSPSK